MNEITIGARALTKVGRNMIEVEVIGFDNGKWRVKSLSTNREFMVSKVETINSTNIMEDTMSDINENIEQENAEQIVPEAENDAPNPAPESGGQPEKKLSLLNAAVKVLEQSQVPLNVKEMLAKAEESGLWMPSGAKTPEQSLYSALFREIRDKENPRIRKSEKRRGAFEFCR